MDSYSIYAKQNYGDEFALLESGITDTNWSDSDAGSYTKRFYKVAAVKGDLNVLPRPRYATGHDELIGAVSPMLHIELVTPDLEKTYHLLNKVYSSFQHIIVS